MFQLSAIIEQVKKFYVYNNRLYLQMDHCIECREITGETVFCIDESFRSFKLKNDKIFVKLHEGHDLLVFNLEGTLLKSFTGHYNLYNAIVSDGNLYIAGKEDGKGKVFRINLQQLVITQSTPAKQAYSKVIKNTGICRWGNTIYGQDLLSGKIAWEVEFRDGEQEVSFFTMPGSDNVVVGTGNHLFLSLDAATGQCNWELNSTFDYYTQHPVNGCLYALGKEQYEVLDIDSGKIIKWKHLQGAEKNYDVWMVAGMARVYEEGLYFISNVLGRKFGRFNIESQEIDYVQELRWPTGVSGHIPVPYAGKVYILDSKDRLHIYSEVY